MVDLYSKFESLTEEKKKKIIDVCIEEFSQNGFKNASTNNIVKNAEISKGILFHYFGNKKRLYLYVFEYVTEVLTGIMYQRMTNLPADFFERTMAMGIIKIKVAYEYPKEYKFLLDAITHTPEEVKHEIQERYAKIVAESMPLMFRDLDTSNFRNDIDKDKAMELIGFALEGVSSKVMKSFQNKSVDEIMSQLESITREYYEYVDILKKGICR